MTERPDTTYIIIHREEGGYRAWYRKGSYLRETMDELAGDILAKDPPSPVVFLLSRYKSSRFKPKKVSVDQKAYEIGVWETWPKMYKENGEWNLRT